MIGSQWYHSLESGDHQKSQNVTYEYRPTLSYGTALYYFVTVLMQNASDRLCFGEKIDFPEVISLRPRHAWLMNGGGRSSANSILVSRQGRLIPRAPNRTTWRTLTGTATSPTSSDWWWWWWYFAAVLYRTAIRPKARFPLTELTARVDGWPVSITRQHGPCWRAPGFH